MKKTKRPLFISVVALILCFSMLLGTTWAWFTDGVTSAGNKIQSGTLKVDLELLDKKTDTWHSLKDSSEPIFNYDKWEPGYTVENILKIENEGSLALKWAAKFASETALSILADVIDVYVKPSDTELAYSDTRSLDGYTYAGTVAEFVNTIEETTNGTLEAGKVAYLGIILKMRENAGNEYQGLSLGGAFDIRIVATQWTGEFESDSFDNQYDKDATYPNVVTNLKLTENVNGKVVDGKLTEQVVFKDSATGITVTLPVGTAVDSEELTLKIVEAGVSNNVTLDNTAGYDVVVEGVSADNTAPIVVYMPKAMPAEMTAFQLFHDGKAMVRVYTIAELSTVDGSGNDTYGDKFFYDVDTGDVYFSITHFSNISMASTQSAVVKGQTMQGIEIDLSNPGDYLVDGKITIPADGNVYIINHTRTDTSTKNALDLTLMHTWHNINPGEMSPTQLLVEMGAKVVLNGVNIRTGADALQIVPDEDGAKYGTKTYIYIADGTNNWLTGRSGIGFGGNWHQTDVYVEGYGVLYATATSWGCAAIGVSDQTDGDHHKMHFDVSFLRAIPMNNSAGIGSGGNSWRTLKLIEFNGSGYYQVYRGGNAASVGSGLNSDRVGEIVVNDTVKIDCFSQPWTAYSRIMGAGIYAGICEGIYISKDATVTKLANYVPSGREKCAEVINEAYEPMVGIANIDAAAMYTVGQTVTVNSVTIDYRDVADEVKTTGFTVGNVDMTTGGRKTVTISYKENGNTVYSSFEIVVKDEFNALIASPKKAIYSVNYNLTVNDFIVDAIASDGTKASISGYEISAVDMTSVGAKTVTVTYTNAVTGKVTSTKCEIDVVNTTILNNKHNLVYFVPHQFYLGDSKTAYMYSAYTPSESNNTEMYTSYIGAFPGGANGEKATGFNNVAKPLNGNNIGTNNLVLGNAQYGLNVTDALPWTTVGVGFIAGYDTAIHGVGYYIDGDINTLNYEAPDFFKQLVENDPGFQGFINQYGVEGFITNTKVSLANFAAGSTHTITWVVVFEDGIQKINDWNITMKSNFGDDNYFKDTEKPNINVIVLSGQSNAAGATVVTQDAINKYASVDYSNIYIQYKNVYFDDLGNLIEDKSMNAGFEKYSFNVGGFQTNTFGPEAALAHHLATDPALKGQQWFIVKYTAPGTSLNLHWQNNFDLSGRMMNFVQECLTSLENEGYDVQLRSFLWMQGENDAIKDAEEANKVSADNYAVNEQNLVSAFRLRFAKYATRPNGSIPGSGISFITAGIAPAGKDGLSLWEYSSIVNAAKVNNAQWWYVPGTLTEYSALYGKVAAIGMHLNPTGGAIYNSAYIDTSLMSTQSFDTAHYDVQSMDWLGNWFGQYVAALMELEGAGNSSGSTTSNKTTYTVTFNANNGTYYPSSATVVKDGFVILGLPTRAGNIFKGWSDGTNTYAAGELYTPTSNVTLTALWDKYTITYPTNATNSITTTVDKTQAAEGETVTITFKNNSYSNSNKTVYVTVTDGNGNTLLERTQIRLGRGGNTTETFTVKTSNVTITVSQN